MLNIFDFGANWEEFSKRRVDQQRLGTACQSLQSLLENESLAGKSFLDVGCGSGLFSIAAHRLGGIQKIAFVATKLDQVLPLRIERNWPNCSGQWSINGGSISAVLNEHALPSARLFQPNLIRTIQSD